MNRYDHKEVESKWQKKWEETRLYASTESADKEKSFVLDMFPYPSGEGLHVGHPKGYIATDIYSRMKRMQGHAVLHPMGWDAFGLPAENFAIKNKIHPRIAVEKNIARFKEQLSRIGLDYDWEREINTTDPSFYKWTQWIFLQLFKKGLAFQSHEPINWCPSCKTGLANEDLENGVCERCGTQVEKKALPQWVLRITDYADRLLEDLSLLPEWPEHIKESQRNWIGRSEGAEIRFKVKSEKFESDVPVFTTRPDTLFGVTYVVLAPEHPLIAELCGTNADQRRIENAEEVTAYVAQAQTKNEIERTAEGREKTGVELKGVRAINPANGEDVPVWVADYVLCDYGTGAVMAVPAHDERDFEFAKMYGLPVRQVIRPVFGIENRRADSVHRETVSAVVRNSKGEILMIRWSTYGWVSPVIGGIDADEDIARAAEREVLEETGYKARAVFVSPISIQSYFYADHKKEWRSRNDRAVLLDLVDEVPADVEPEEKARHTAHWMTPDKAIAESTFLYNTFAIKLALGIDAIYTETGTLINSGSFDGMDSEESKRKITEHVGGKWVTKYRLRDWVFSRQRYWGEPIPLIHCEKCGVVPVPESELPVLLPEVDSYEPSGTGESPLAAITDWVNTTCPQCGGAGKRETNTMPQWAGSSWYYLRYMDPRNDTALVSPDREKFWAPVDVYVGGAEHATRHLIYARFWHKFLYDIGVVTTKEPFSRLHSVGLILAEDGRKMSKRFGNVINPDDVIDRFGADAFRLYEAFMGPFDNAIAWNTASITGVRRFVERLVRLSEKVADEDVAALVVPLNVTIKKVGGDIESFKFNTAVSQMMIFLNAAEEAGSIGHMQFCTFVRLLAPFAPHITEELWAECGGEGSVHVAPWPAFDEKKLGGDTHTIAVQINGKVRGVCEVPAGATEDETVAAARGAVGERLAGETVARTVVVPGRLVNFVLG